MPCDSGHAINIPGEPLPPDAGGIGPELPPGEATLPEPYLAESITKAHPVVVAPGYVAQEGKAIMGTSNHCLTVQVLIDLVAFLTPLRGSHAR